MADEIPTLRDQLRELADYASEAPSQSPMLAEMVRLMRDAADALPDPPRVAMSDQTAPACPICGDIAACAHLAASGADRTRHAVNHERVWEGLSGDWSSAHDATNFDEVG